MDSNVKTNKELIEFNILGLLDNIQDRLDVLMSKETNYSLDILNNLEEDLKLTLKNLKRGK